jgi:hypothetical protein
VWFSYYLSHDRSCTRMDEHLWGVGFSFNSPPPPPPQVQATSFFHCTNLSTTRADAATHDLHLQLLTCSSLVVQTYLADHDLPKLKTLMWDVEIPSYIYAYIYNYISFTHLHRTINYILHHLCKKYSCCKALLLLLLTSCELHPLYIRSDPCRKNSDPRLNLLEKLRSCQQLLLISILL